MQLRVAAGGSLSTWALRHAVLIVIVIVRPTTEAPRDSETEPDRTELQGPARREHRRHAAIRVLPYIPPAAWPALSRGVSCRVIKWILTPSLGLCLLDGPDGDPDSGRGGGVLWRRRHQRQAASTHEASRVVPQEDLHRRRQHGEADRCPKARRESLYDGVTRVRVQRATDQGACGDSDVGSTTPASVANSITTQPQRREQPPQQAQQRRNQQQRPQELQSPPAVAVHPYGFRFLRTCQSAHCVGAVVEAHVHGHLVAVGVSYDEIRMDGRVHGKNQAEGAKAAHHDAYHAALVVLLHAVTERCVRRHQRLTTNSQPPARPLLC
jgi:hypothetical protein